MKYLKVAIRYILWYYTLCWNCIYSGTLIMSFIKIEKSRVMNPGDVIKISVKKQKNNNYYATIFLGGFYKKHFSGNERCNIFFDDEENNKMMIKSENDIKDVYKITINKHKTSGKIQFKMPPEVKLNTSNGEFSGECKIVSEKGNEIIFKIE